jgi:shikimate kinase
VAGTRTAGKAHERPIWLVGMMACGKSTVGPVLARRLGRPFVDSDARICEIAGRSIAEIFREQGEDAFRELETDVIEEASQGRAVVALGGGAIAQSGAAVRLARTGTVVYLRASPAKLLERLEDASTRPLLAGLSGPARADRLAQLLAEREQAYQSASIVVDTDTAGADEVADEVARRFTADTHSGAEQGGGAERGESANESA